MSEVLEGSVRDVTDAGDSVVETPRGIVMARGGLPGERVRVRVERSRAGVARGTTLGVLSASPARVQPVCPWVESCGGCPLMALALPAQRALKLERVRRALAGLAEPDVTVQLEAAGEALAYRQRARFGYRRVGSGLVLGYHAHASRRLVDVDACAILAPELAQALTALREELSTALEGSGEIELSHVAGRGVLATLRSDGPLPEAAYRAAEALPRRAPISAVALQVGGGAAARFGDFSTPGVDEDGLPLLSAAGSFSQIHRTVNARLRALVLELSGADGARVLELYAGQGNFALPLASRAAALLAVEGNPTSADVCRANLRARGLSHARVIAGEVGQAKLSERSDVIVLDPPRSGAPELAAIAARVRAARVVYVSCHMTTLGRDLRALRDAGFRAERAHALDMFPQTAHIEAVVRMTR
jgi:23S rRNA (uracil1939-C5)-methyltransferase